MRLCELMSHTQLHDHEKKDDSEKKPGVNDGKSESKILKAYLKRSLEWTKVEDSDIPPKPELELPVSELQHWI